MCQVCVLVHVLYVGVKLFHPRLLVKHLLLHCVAFALLLCQRSVNYIYGDVFLGSYLFHQSTCLFFQKYHTFLGFYFLVLNLDNDSFQLSYSLILAVLSLLPLHAYLCNKKKQRLFQKSPENALLNSISKTVSHGQC